MPQKGSTFSSSVLRVGLRVNGQLIGRWARFLIGLPTSRLPSSVGACVGNPGYGLCKAEVVYNRCAQRTRTHIMSSCKVVFRTIY